MVLPDQPAGTAREPLLGFLDRGNVRHVGVSSTWDRSILCLATLLYVPSEHLCAVQPTALELNALPFGAAKQASLVSDARQLGRVQQMGGTMTRSNTGTKVQARAKSGKRKPARASAASSWTCARGLR